MSIIKINLVEVSDLLAWDILKRNHNISTDELAEDYFLELSSDGTFKFKKEYQNEYNEWYDYYWNLIKNIHE